MRQRHKPWAVPYLESIPQYVLSLTPATEAIDVPDSFSCFALEIGVGKGDFIIEMAQKNPACFYYGVELQASVLALALQKATSLHLANVRFIWGNAQRLQTLFPSLFFESIYLNFSDPWPKKRHEKRRLTSSFFLQQYYSLLTTKGRIYVKTDNTDFFDYSLSQFLPPRWTIIQQESPYRWIEERDAPTEYELRFRASGKPIHRLIVQKEELHDEIK